MTPFDPSPREDEREERARLIQEASAAKARDAEEEERVAALVARFRAEFILDIERAATLSDLRDVIEGWLVLLRTVPKGTLKRDGE